VAGCSGGDSDDTSPRVLGVTVTTSTTVAPTTTSTTAAAAATTTTAVPQAPPTTTTTTTTAPPPPPPTTGTVDVTYEGIRPNATITVAIEDPAGAVVASQDATTTRRATFPAVAPGRYRVAVTETGRPEESTGNTTSSAVVTRTEQFDVVAGGTVSVSCVGNGDCTVVA